MNRRNGALPLTRGEFAWVSSTTIVTALVLIFLLLGFDTSTLFFERVRAVEVHRPLPDLCTALPGVVFDGSTLRPEADTRTVDRNEVGCTFRTPKGGSETETRVILEAHRPEPDAYEGNGEVAEARRQFRERYDADEGSYTPLSGLGTEAKIRATSDEISRRVEIVVRDGVLLTEVDYEVTKVHDYDPLPDLATVRADARKLATELLTVLPPKGG